MGLRCFQIKFEQYRNAIVKLSAVAVIPPIVDERRTPTFLPEKNLS